MFPDFFTSRRRKRRIGGGMSLPEAAVKYTGERGSQSLEPAWVHADLGLVFLSLSLSLLLWGMAPSCRPFRVEQCSGPGTEQVLCYEQ